jgi:hypothetical protein
MDSLTTFRYTLAELRRRWRLSEIKERGMIVPQIDTAIRIRTRRYLEGAKRQFENDFNVLKEINRLQYELDMEEVADGERDVMDDIAEESNLVLSILRRRNQQDNR